MKTVIIAFSGGVESMYLAQMYIEQGYSVELLCKVNVFVVVLFMLLDG